MSSEELNNFFLSCVFRVLEENRHTSNETVTLLLFINEDCNLCRTCRDSSVGFFISSWARKKTGQPRAPNSLGSWKTSFRRRMCKNLQILIIKVITQLSCKIVDYIRGITKQKCDIYIHRNRGQEM